MHSDPILQFNLFGTEIKVTLYGVFLAIALIAVLLVYKYYTDYKKINQKVQDFGFISAIIGIAGGFFFAKLFQAFYDYLNNGYFDFANAGITAMGGFIGGTICYVIFYFTFGHFYFSTGKEKDIHVKEVNKIVLVAPCCIAIGHAFGRLGCLMAGCCHGAEVGAGQGGILMNGHYYIPIQLYESLFLFALFAVLSLLYFKRLNLTHIVYLVSYAIWRFIVEFFRQDYRGGDMLGMTPSQFQSVVFVIGAIIIAIVLFVVWKKPVRLPPDKDPLAEDEPKQV